MYWVATELAEMLPQAVIGRPLIGPTSRPVSASQFERIIQLVSAEFDGAAAGAGYQVPIPSTASQAWDYARLVVGYGARWQVLEQITPGHKTADEMRSAYKAAIDQIREGRQPILQASEPGTSGRALPRGGGIASPVISASWCP